MDWRPHQDDGYCDYKRCRKPYTETHNSKRRVYATCNDHIEAAIAASSEDNRR